MLDIERTNKSKYKGPPTFKHIEKRLKQFNMKGAHFELYFGIPGGTISKVKNGERAMPVKFWHLIFQGINQIPKNKTKIETVTKPPTSASLSIVMDTLKNKLK